MTSNQVLLILACRMTFRIIFKMFRMTFESTFRMTFKTWCFRGVYLRRTFKGTKLALNVACNKCLARGSNPPRC